MPSATERLPTHQTAIVVNSAGKLHIRPDAPVPGPPSSGTAIIRTAAVAINPVDAKMLDYSPVPGASHGYDFAGTIVALGPDTHDHQLQVGDRVAGFVHGMNKAHPDVGAFAEYVVAPTGLLLRIPPSMRFEDAATIGLGLYTAGLGLFEELRLPFPPHDNSTTTSPSDAHEDNEAPFVLVAGGSTATGTRAIQLLKHAGFRPITTCSPRHFALVRRFGAEQAFDYAAADTAAAIRAYTRNTLAAALDCIAEAETTQLCYGALGRAGGRYATVEPFRAAIAAQRALTVTPSWLLAVTVFGRKVELDGEYAREARPQDEALGLRLAAYAQTLLDEGKLDAHPVEVLTGGWEAVLRGVDIVRKQTMSGQKLVCPV